MLLWTDSLVIKYPSDLVIRFTFRQWDLSWSQRPGFGIYRERLVLCQPMSFKTTIHVIWPQLVPHNSSFRFSEQIVQFLDIILHLSECVLAKDLSPYTTYNHVCVSLYTFGYCACLSTYPDMVSICIHPDIYCMRWYTHRHCEQLYMWQDGNEELGFSQVGLWIAKIIAYG